MNGKRKSRRLGMLATVCMFVPATALGAEATTHETTPATDAVEASSAGLQERSAYERARQALNQAEYARAIELFRDYRSDNQDGRYLPESLYWEAFALSRMESRANLRSALDVLRTHLDRYENASTAADARALLARVHGELARRGDSESARWIYENTADAARDEGREARESREAREAERAVQDQERDVRGDEAKLAALQALMNMDSEAAMPILRRIVQNRDNNPELRTHALFILSQQEGEDVTDLMLEAARTDPDPGVREQAVFWLSEAEVGEALPILESILASPDDAELHDQAVFAIAQMDDPRARRVLRDFARSDAADADLRAAAIFQIGQDDSAESAAFLREIWDTQPDPRIRESILFAVSQMDEPGNAAWLMDVALDTSEDVDVRKQALFAASQRDDVRVADLARIFDQAPDPELKKQALFVMSQSDDPAAFDKMVEVVRDESDPELQQVAIFWLGQSGDPRAQDILMEILESE